METELKFRPYDRNSKEDEILINGWREFHGRAKMPSSAMSPFSIIVESNGVPVSFCSCYAAFGCGFAWVDWITARPGNSLSISRKAIAMAVEESIVSADLFCKNNGEGISIVYGALEESLANEAEKIGFIRCGSGATIVAKRIDGKGNGYG